MKFQTLGLFILILLLAANIYMFVKLKEIDANIEERNHPEASHKEEGKAEVELIQIMKDNLYYMDKLYFAGKAENWELAKFYHHELEEGMEKVTEQQVYYDGHDITKLSKGMLEPPLVELESGIDEKDKAIFDERYTMLVRSCNNCHIATEHPFIKITLPQQPAFSNQSFSK